MRAGTYTHESASLRLTESELVAEALRPKLREISLLESAEPGRGHAGALMRRVMATADDHGITLMLVPEPYGDVIGACGELTADDLKAWYGRLGFTQIQAEPCVMARPPKRKLNG